MIKLMPIKIILLQSFKILLPFMKAFPLLVGVVFIAAICENYIELYKVIDKSTSILEIIKFSIFQSIPKSFLVLVSYQIYRFVILKETTFDFKKILSQKFYWILLSIYVFLDLLINIFVYYANFIDHNAPDSDMVNNAIIISVILMFLLILYLFIRMNNILAALALEIKNINYISLFKQTHHYVARIFVLFVFITMPILLFRVYIRYSPYSFEELVPAVVDALIYTFVFILEDVQIALIYLFLNDNKPHDKV